MSTPEESFVLDYAPLFTAGGTILGALTGGFVNWMSGHATSRKNRTLDIVIEFWSPTMTEHRHRVWKRCNEILVQASADSCAIVNYYHAAQSDDPLFLSFIAVLGYYQKLAKQCQANRLVRGICVDQIKPEFDRFHKQIARPGFDGLTSEDRDDWVTAHDDLEALSEWLG